MLPTAEEYVPGLQVAASTHTKPVPVYPALQVQVFVSDELPAAHVCVWVAYVEQLAQVTQVDEMVAPAAVE